MTEDEKEDKQAVYGTEWEVVSLTASTYAAPPGCKEFEPSDESKHIEFDGLKYSCPLFMSKHFEFPLTELENFGTKPKHIETQHESADKDANPAEVETCVPDKSIEESFKSDDSLHGIQFFDKGKKNDMEFGEGKALEELSLVGEDPAVFGAPGFDAFHAEMDISGSVLCNESNISKLDCCSDHNSDCPPYSAHAYEQSENDGSVLQCEPWWKRQVIVWYKHAKEGNTFWSVVVAAALMGFVILGQHWQKEKLQLQQLKWQFSININDQGLKQMLGPISRFKGVLLNGHQRRQMILGHCYFQPSR